MQKKAALRNYASQYYLNENELQNRKVCRNLLFQDLQLFWSHLQLCPAWLFKIMSKLEIQTRFWFHLQLGLIYNWSDLRLKFGLIYKCALHGYLKLCRN